MKHSFKKSFLLVITLLALIINALGGVTLAKAAGSPPAYYPFGPQTNVPESQLVGWELCWSSTYDSSVSLPTILTACDGDYLLLAGRPIGSTVFDVVAAGPRADVLFDTGYYDYYTTHTANGVGWYFNSGWSWGFALAGDSVYKYTCDTDYSNPNLRLCWHINSNSITYGYRSGNNYYGNNGERLIYQPVPSTVSFSPNPWDFGNQTIGTTSSAKSFTLTNIDTVNLNIGTLSVSAGFNLLNDLCSNQPISASGTCTFEVTFSPVSFGANSGTVSVPSDSPFTPDILPVSGTGYSAPPVIDILSILPDAGDLSASIDLSDPENDPLSGAVKIMLGAGTPTSVTFETLDTCGGSAMQLSLNGGLIGTTPANNYGCTCTPPLDSANFSGSEIAANFDSNGDNTWTYSKADNYTAWSRITVQYPDSSTQSSCLFDRTGTGCTTMDLCYNNTQMSGPATGSATLASQNTILTSQSYTNSSLPASLDTSALAPGDYTLYADASDGYNSSVSATQLFTLTNEPLLLISNPSAVDTTAPSVTIEQAEGQSDPANAAPIVFEVLFSEEVTGFDETDVDLSASTASGTLSAVVAEVAPNDGTTYMVSVSGMSGDGDVIASIPAAAAQDIALNDSEASTSKDNLVIYDATAPETSISGVEPVEDPTSNTSMGIAFSSNEEGTTFQCALDLDEYGNCSSPTSLSNLEDGSHTFYVYATDKAVNDDESPASYSWMVDANDPTVIINSQPSTPTNVTSADFEFTSGDGAGTGVASTECKLDLGAFGACDSSAVHNYAGPLGDGQHTFTVQVTDGVGHTGSDSFTWTVDTTASTITIDTYPAALSNSANANFTFTADDGSGTGIASVECDINGKGYAACDLPTSHSYSGLSDGQNVFTVKVTDNVGNTSTDSYTWTVDTTAPTVANVTSSTSDGSYKAGEIIQVNVAFDEAVDVDTTGGTPSLCFETGTTDQCVNYASGSGTSTLIFDDYTVQAGDTSADLDYVDANALSLNGATIKDAATNTANLTLPAPGAASSFGANNNFVIDTTAPLAAIDTKPSDPSSSVLATFDFSATDNFTASPNFSFFCNLDSAAWVSCDSGTISYSSLANGSHTFDLDAYDEAGNVDSKSYTWSVVDATAPTVNTFVATSPSNSLNIPITAFTAADNTGVSGYLITTSATPPLSGASGWTGSTPTTYSVVSNGSYTLYPWAKDASGNVSAVFDTPRTVTVDTTAPAVTSITRVGTSPTSAASVDFTVTFSESVTGVDTADFTLTTSGVSGAAVSGVSGSGSAYTVTVSTGTGNGTIRLDVVDDDTILDAALNPLGTGFTGGQPYTVSKLPIFDDVPYSYWANSFIERLYNDGITSGCSTSPLNYCPDATVTRAQMAIFILRSMHGNTYTPPAATGTVFNDVALGSFADAWIEQLAAEGITSGCNSDNYCPDQNVTRAQMSIFLLRAEHGSAYTPPTATGTVFGDVALGSFADAWIEQLALEGITNGCGGGNYCPNNSVTRAEMAVLLMKAFNLP